MQPRPRHQGPHYHQIVELGHKGRYRAVAELIVSLVNQHPHTRMQQLHNGAVRGHTPGWVVRRRQGHHFDVALAAHYCKDGVGVYVEAVVEGHLHERCPGPRRSGVMLREGRRAGNHTVARLQKSVQQPFD